MRKRVSLHAILAHICTYHHIGESALSLARAKIYLSKGNATVPQEHRADLWIMTAAWMMDEQTERERDPLPQRVTSAKKTAF